ncbi:hypothetical protein nbrc107696_13430 [Gordonia spumicola]|uniref:Mce-associated membrane protein n=1 Tax=Gordonia spumicola TaxID=589161 RepID=A0A7I9V6I4_9ACTN|nr:hypothetical protein [Gordonia spumicola]GEE00897.1 hypothetical protein nbrc107696_13430 [Gordonia spumicola]
MATDTIELDETAESEAPVTVAKSSPVTRARPPASAALYVVIALLVAATGFFGYRYFTADDAPVSASDGDRAAVQSMAVDFAVKFSSFDYRDLNKSRAAVNGMSTPGFASRYDEMVKALSEIVANGQGVATAEVTHSAVETLDGDKATVLLFVDQKATNVVAPTGKNQPYRMFMTLKKSDGHWLVDDVQTL